MEQASDALVANYRFLARYNRWFNERLYDGCELDDAIEGWTRDMPADFPLRTMRYSNSKGVQRAHPMWQALSHFFNHQTHHRGQVTTLLSQTGVDVGVTDMIALV